MPKPKKLTTKQLLELDTVAEAIKLRPCKPKSSNIAKYGYDLANKLLVISFIDGATWHYSDVPEKKYDEFHRAKSKGVFFHQQIKLSHFARVLSDP